MSEMLPIPLLLIAAGFGIAAAALFYAVAGLWSKLPPDQRENMDRPPLPVRLLWPLVCFFSYFIGSRLPVDRLQIVQKRLQGAGLDYMLLPEQFFGLQASSASLFLLLATLLFPFVPSAWLVWLALLPVAGFFYPWLWVVDTRARRRRAIQKMLPVYLDFISMAVEAGLNLSGAISQVVEKGPQGALRFEFSRVLREIRSGLSRADALRRMADRTDLAPMYSFVSTVIQAERTGGSLGPTLKTMANQRRIERFQAAEKIAMEAPVKLVGPLVLFIFPVTFIVLAFPLAMKFLSQGTL
jgi:tight adherence protein C